MIKITFNMGAKSLGVIQVPEPIKLSEALEKAGVKIPKGYRIIKRTKLHYKEYQVYPATRIPANTNLYIVPSSRGTAY